MPLNILIRFFCSHQFEISLEFWKQLHRDSIFRLSNFLPPPTMRIKVTLLSHWENYMNRVDIDELLEQL